MVRGALEGYSPWGHIESDTTEKLTHTLSLRKHAEFWLLITSK